jgi:hypothetical protein
VKKLWLQRFELLIDNAHFNVVISNVRSFMIYHMCPPTAMMLVVECNFTFELLPLSCRDNHQEREIEISSTFTRHENINVQAQALQGGILVFRQPPCCTSDSAFLSFVSGRSSQVVSLDVASSPLLIAFCGSFCLFFVSLASVRDYGEPSSRDIEWCLMYCMLSLLGKKKRNCV